MSPSASVFAQLSDPDLLREVTRLAARERQATACLVASLAELNARRLYLAEGYASLFAYSTQALHLSEAAAYKRIAAARAVHRFPVILERLAEGTITLSTVSLLAPHLTVANHVALLDEIQHRSKREVERIVARLQPRADVPSSVRKLPTTTRSPHTAHTAIQSTTKDDAPTTLHPDATQVETPPSRPSTVRPSAAGAARPPMSPPTPDARGRKHDSSTVADTGSAEGRRAHATATPADAPRAAVTPLAPARYKVSFTVGAETYEKLRQAQDLLRHVVPNGDLAVLFDRALTLLLDQVAKTKLAATDTPRASDGPARGSRRIPAAVKRAVWERDGGQCAFVSASGHRCTERGWLEFHHGVPYARGGEASVENTSLRCRRHNAHEAERDFGPWTATSVREPRPGDGPALVSALEVPSADTWDRVSGGASDRHRPSPQSGGCAGSWPRGESCARHNMPERAHVPIALGQDKVDALRHLVIPERARFALGCGGITVHR
ncbi:MAG: hypothetical protein GEU99_02735 [Luteitalea sp.]|nr:hypothetical protein [Luteitalea sp.]